MKNREIKFRAFGKNSKEFLGNSNNYALSLKEIQNIEDIDSWEFSQFTGLLDKNGRSIYEGDIVKTNDKSHIADVEKGYIFMSEEGGCWCIQDMGSDESVMIDLYTWLGDGTDDRKECGFTVIGNIYEIN